MTEAPMCPQCAGPQMVGAPQGWLTFRHTMQCALRALEDSRHVADLDLLAGALRVARPATDTERTLLAVLGYVWAEPDQNQLLTEVTALSPYVLQRRWPALEPSADGAA